MFGSNDVFVASCSDEYIDLFDQLLDGSDFVSLHAGLKGTDGVNLADKDSWSGSFHGAGASFSNISITENEHLLSGEHHVSGSVDSVRKGVFASVNIVEFGLGHTVINVNGGERKSFLIL